MTRRLAVVLCIALIGPLLPACSDALTGAVREGTRAGDFVTRSPVASTTTRGVALWYMTERRAHRLAGPVSQGFGVSPLGRRIVFGKTDLRTAVGPSRLTLLGGPGFERVEASTRLARSHAGAGSFVGRRVFVGWGDGGHVVLALWDPATGVITHLPRFTGVGDVDAVSRRVVLVYGDGGCWSTGTWFGPGSRLVRGQRCFRPTVLSPSSTWIAGLSGSVDGGLTGSAENRLVVREALGPSLVFRSEPLPGAFQVAWADESHVLVLGRQEEGDVVVDGGRGFAIWPEHTGRQAARACLDPPMWRHTPRATAEEFGRSVLGWSAATGTIRSFDHHSVEAALVDGVASSSAGVRVWMHRVGFRCWVVGSVSPTRPRGAGFGVEVTGRQVTVAAQRHGTSSSTLIAGFAGQRATATFASANGSLHLPFRARGSGFVLLLLRGPDGRVVSAYGAIAHAGLVAG